MDENFFQRWSRRKAEHAQEQGIATGAPLRKEPVPDEEAGIGKKNGKLVQPGDASLPSLKDVAQLNSDSDYSLFITKEVDKTVRRAALKKLFSDPHFNVMDKLDIYIDDYTKPSPIPPAMLAALSHTKSVFGPVAEVADAEEKQGANEEHAATEARAETETQALDALSAGNEEGGYPSADPPIEKKQLVQTSPFIQGHMNIAGESENPSGSSSG